MTETRPEQRKSHWRFFDLEVWQAAADLAVEFHRVAQFLDKRRLFRYADQLRAAGLSVANNIAEGSGSPHLAEFRQFLNIGRRSLFETASMVLVFQRLNLLTAPEAEHLLERADKLSRQLYLLMVRSVSGKREAASGKGEVGS